MDDIATARQVGIVVRRARKRASLTQAQLAMNAGVSTRLITSLELGDNRGIQLDKLLAILQALGLTMTIRGMDRKTLLQADAETPAERTAPKPPLTDQSTPDDSNASLMDLYQIALEKKQAEAARHETH